MAKKTAKRKITSSKKSSVPFTALHFFGKKLHPVWSLIGGVIMTPIGGILSIFGAIITIASLVALAVHFLGKNKR